MELTRKQVIEELQKMLDYCSIRQDSTPERKQAIVYAISSLKTDEAYQIMYEGGEIYTKADMVAMLEELKADIEGNGIVDFEETYVDDGECIISVSECNRLIQEKINALKGDK